MSLFIDEWGDLKLRWVIVPGIILVILLIALATFSQWTTSEENVSGIVYNTTNNSIISGNTSFMIRASVDTYVYRNSDGSTNESAYCLPPNSQYKDLINKAAADKNIKVQVTTKKGYWWKAPWTCIDNVTVVQVKENK